MVEKLKSMYNSSKEYVIGSLAVAGAVLVSGSASAQIASSTQQLQTDLASGFTELVDVATNFIGDNIELILGVVITLVVFSWFIGWLIGGFRRR